MAKPRTAVSARYTVDLRSQQAECEANYVRLCKLLPEMDDREQWDYSVDGAANSQAERVRLRLLERSPYTTTVEVKQVEASHPWEDARVLRVRLYHDARMAEVVSWNNTHWNTRSRYQYPNEQMYHRDEKLQLNRFLGEWLAHCLTRGRVFSPITG